MTADIRARRCWRIRIQAHTVAGRYAIPESSEQRFESDSVTAAAQAVRNAHIDAGVPPWRPFLRESVPFVSRTASVWTPEDA